jgi:hypothetical protein
MTIHYRVHDSDYGQYTYLSCIWIAKIKQKKKQKTTQKEQSNKKKLSFSGVRVPWSLVFCIVF